MSTATQAPPDKKQAGENPHRLVKCPNCNHYVHFDEITPRVPDEFPKVLYKVQADKPAGPPQIVDTVVVLNEDEEKKKIGDGYSEEIPKPKAEDKKAEPPKPPEHKAPEAGPPHPQGTPAHHDEAKKK